MTILAAVFLILHGLVHLLYLGQSIRAFELQPGMIWPDGAWAFAPRFDISLTRRVAGVGLVLAAVMFVVAGVTLMLGLAWWRSWVIAAALFSSLLYLLCWDGTRRRLDNQGWIGILLNVMILISVLGLGWPS